MFKNANHVKIKEYIYIIIAKLTILFATSSTSGELYIIVPSAWIVTRACSQKIHLLSCIPRNRLSSCDIELSQSFALCAYPLDPR